MSRPVPGLRTPGGILIFEFQPSVGILADRINTLGRKIDNFREPLVKSVQMVVIPSIRKNFKVGGRPSWEPLAAYTVKLRGDSGPILRRTGRLERAATQTSIWHFTDTAASIQTWPASVWYGQLHQAGYERGGPNVAAARATRRGGPLRAGVVSAAEIMKGRQKSREIPARPFIMYQEEDIPKIHKIFDEWLEEKIGEAWGRGR